MTTPGGGFQAGWSPNNTGGKEGRIYWDGQQFGYRSSDGTTYFDHQDTLGTERMRTDFGAGAGSSYASLPWGDGYSGDHRSLLEPIRTTSTLPAWSRTKTPATFPCRSMPNRQYSFCRTMVAPDPDMGSYDLSNPQSLNDTRMC